MFSRLPILAAAAASVLALLGPIAAKAADIIPYGSSGSYNAATYSFTAATDGDIVAYFVGGAGAGYENELGLMVNGVLQGGYGLNNHATAVGTSYNFGSVHASDSLVFVLRNLSLGQDAFSDASLNGGYDLAGYTGGHNHIYSTSYTATSPLFSGVPAGIYAGFEDLPFADSDFNYDDESFVFTNVASRITSGVPEPMTWALMIVGFGGLGSAMRLQRRRLAAAG